MRTADWLTVLGSLTAGVLIPVLVIVARVARRSGSIEQKLDDLAAKELEQDSRFADIFTGLERRLRWLEERIWGRDPRFPRRGQGGQGSLPGRGARPASTGLRG